MLLLGCFSIFFAAAFNNKIQNSFYIRRLSFTATRTSAKNEVESNEKDEDFIGIGGLDGFVYDLNPLKRNLVQETQSAYKRELIELLESPYQDLLTRSNLENKRPDDLIQEKLAVLITANPVSTTTDSNLLDGSWKFVFVVVNAKQFLQKEVNASFMPKSLSYTKKSRRFSNGKRKGVFRSSTRDVYLEDLRDEEDPYIVDKKIALGGLLEYQNFYKVTKLSRQSLHLTKFKFNLKFKLFEGLYFLNVRKPHKRALRNNFNSKKNEGEVVEHILYLDSDLCIFTVQDFNGPLFVIKKTELWENKEGKKGFLKSIQSLLSSIHSPFRIRKLLSKIFRRTDKDTPFLDSLNRQTKSKESRKSTKVSFLPIGEVITNLDEEDKAWSCDEDPFMNLDSKDERLKVINKMSIEELEAAGKLQKIKTKKLMQEKQNKWNSKKKFKKPPMSS